jgi:heme oxygenase (biliverdin-IX-beta and delta-forming)
MSGRDATVSAGRGAAASRSSLRRRLRDETAAMHRAVERALPLLDADLSLERYQRALRVLYGYYEPLEARLAQMAELPRLGVPFARRAPLLERDLLALGMAPEGIVAIRRCSVLPGLTGLEHLAGAVYVLEGASLGGRVVARVLQRRLAIGRSNGGSFFLSDGHGAASRWAAFVAWLDALPNAGASSDAIVSSARDTFSTLAQWVRHAGGNR